MLLSELASLAGATLEGDGTVRITRVATLEAAGPETIAFLANPKYRGKLAATAATAVIVAPEMASATPLPKLVSVNPYATYAKVATLLHPPVPAAPGVHATAILGDGARIARSATIGPYAVIGAGATVGERARVGPGCVIGAETTIGDDALLHARVTIYDRLRDRSADDHPQRRGHRRRRLRNGRGSRPLAQDPADRPGRRSAPTSKSARTRRSIAARSTTRSSRTTSSSTTRSRSATTAGSARTRRLPAASGIAGSVRIGKNCKIGGASMIAGHLSIVDGTVIYGGTSVGSSIDTPGVYGRGMLPLPAAEWRRVALRCAGCASSPRESARSSEAGGRQARRSGTGTRHSDERRRKHGG